MGVPLAVRVSYLLNKLYYSRLLLYFTRNKMISVVRYLFLSLWPLLKVTRSVKSYIDLIQLLSLFLLISMMKLGSFFFFTSLRVIIPLLIHMSNILICAVSFVCPSLCRAKNVMMGIVCALLNQILSHYALFSWTENLSNFMSFPEVFDTTSTKPNGFIN